jgi:hypothetical protein
VAKANNDQDDPPFKSGGTALPIVNNVVTLTGVANNTSPFDIYVFDNTGDTNARVLQWIALDYEESANPAPGQGSNPISSAPSLRSGMTGASFMGAQNGGGNGTTTGVGEENDIVCAGGVASTRRWSFSAGYSEKLAPGNYNFTCGFVVWSPQGIVKGFTVDPEMDIQT